MGFGLNYESSGGGDFLPIVKYDSKAGRMFRVDRVESGGSYSSQPTDITNTFKAVVDLEHVEVGYINFDTGGAPDFVLVPLGDPMPHKPGDKHRQGVRVMLKLHASCGGDVREIASVAKAALRGLDELHSTYERLKADNPGKLPIVVLKETKPITTGEGARKSTNYQPVFEIVGWATRPTDLVFKPKGRGAQVNGSTSSASPPATGSTRVDAPAAKQPAMAEADDFG